MMLKTTVEFNRGYGRLFRQAIDAYEFENSQQPFPKITEDVLLDDGTSALTIEVADVNQLFVLGRIYEAILRGSITRLVEKPSLVVHLNSEGISKCKAPK